MPTVIYVVVAFGYPEDDNDAQYDQVVAAYTDEEDAKKRAAANPGICHVETVNLYPKAQ